MMLTGREAHRHSSRSKNNQQDYNVMSTPLQLDREAWLTESAGLILDELIAPHCTLPTDRDFRISLGFPSGKVSNVIAQCWVAAASADNTNEIFVTPIIDDSIEILASLVHELIHYVDDCASGHKNHFAKVARKVGLEGKLTATTAGAALAEQLDQYVALLGPIPHAKITPSKSGIKKQGTRMIKVECTTCGFAFRATRTHLDNMHHNHCLSCDTGTLEVMA
jgi:hypothetical protein